MQQITIKNKKNVMNNQQMIRLLRKIATSGPLPIKTHNIILDALLKLLREKQ